MWPFSRPARLGLLLIVMMMADTPVAKRPRRSAAAKAAQQLTAPKQSIKQRATSLAQLVKDLRTKGNVCVTELITHAWEAAAAHYGSLGCEDYWVYHDALIMMTDKRCREWMQAPERDYFRRWIVPLFGLNDVVHGKDKHGNWTASTVYKLRPTGDSPEFVALDCHLNKDARDCAEFHAAVTTHLETGDPHKFDLSSYKKQTEAYMRLLHPAGVGVSTLSACACTGAPSQCCCGALPSKRIYEDVVKCLSPNIMEVFNAFGTVVDGLGNRNGDRRQKATWSMPKASGGGRKTRKERLEEVEKEGWGSGLWIHPDARAAWNAAAGL
jgi:hypothetical protein